MKRIDIATPEEVLEAEMAIITAAGVKVRHVGFQKDGQGGGIHLYDVLEPVVPGYVYHKDSAPVTLTINGMREKGLLPPLDQSQINIIVAVAKKMRGGV